MSTTHSRNPIVESIAPEAELAKLSEQTPESKKSEIIGKTREKVGRFAGVFGLAATLTTGTPAMATESPYEPLADASGKTVLVLKEEGKGKEELFAAFERNNKSEKREIFSGLSGEQQKKVLSYYQTGKGEQSNEKELLKWVYNLMRLYENIQIAKQGIADFNNGKEATKFPMTLEPMIKFIVEAFPSWKNFIDTVAIQKIDEMVKSVYLQIKEQSKQKIAEWERKITELQKNIKELKALLQAL
ncbi:MAG: hypothetical protein ACD_78C00320G0005 [uncultured bacterium (gcode 4)]|uniref:Uncharacterized protein n=1 Tax=uncultured bacterium (gcode 4) TaxID=1234023 RepID=K1XXM8_9BACT|nr:MAG: hypothetical protein ACD_78C00320G0005 [uncultured bacterium (gcode 4)]